MLTTTKSYDQGLGVGPSPLLLGQYLKVQQLACSPLLYQVLVSLESQQLSSK